MDHLFELASQYYFFDVAALAIASLFFFNTVIRTRLRGVLWGVSILTVWLLVRFYDYLPMSADTREELVELIFDWNFVNIAVPLIIIIYVGSGLVRTRYKGIVWGVALAVLWAALHVGIGRHEWGEVFFNGTLL